MLHRSLLLVSLLFAANAQAESGAMHASPNGGGCPTPLVEASVPTEEATTATEATASADVAVPSEKATTKAAAPALLHWRSFLPGMLK